MYLAMILRAISRATSRVTCPADLNVRGFPCSQVTTQALCPLGCTRSRKAAYLLRVPELVGAILGLGCRDESLGEGGD